MKRFYPRLATALSSILLYIAGQSFATTQTIHVGGLSFTPSALAAQLGDTLLFVWDDGSHTTTSTTLPPGAIAWNQPINAGSPSFQYVPAVTGTYNYVCTPHQAMGMTGSFTITAPLPLQITSFSVSPSDKGAALAWTAATGKNINRFEVEHSTDGAQFRTIAQLPPVEKEGQHTYGFTDAHWVKAANYYRVKSVDKDGTFSYTPVLSIVNKTTDASYVHLLSNPVSAVLPLHIMGPDAGLDLRIVDLSGKVVQSKTIPKGYSGTLNIDLGALSAGQYYLQVHGNSIHQTIKFTRQ